MTPEKRTGSRQGRHGLFCSSGVVLGAAILAACGGAHHHDGGAEVTVDGGSADGQDGPDPAGRDASLEILVDAQLAPDGPATLPPDFVTGLPSIEAFFEMLGQNGDIKVLGQVEGALPPASGLGYPCVFQNTLRFPGHAPFLRSFPELRDMSFDAYLNMVMKRSSRVLWGGALQFYPAVPHPITGVDGILGYFLYSGATEADALTDDEIAAFDARIKACVPFARELLVLVGMDPDQAARFDALRERLTGRGVSVLPAGQLRPSFSGQGYSLGESFGTLNLVPAGEVARHYGPREVVVTEVAPSEMSAVAGLITTTAQDPEGQLNLSLRRSAIPNGHVPGMYRNSVLTLLVGRPVHIVVQAGRIQIDPTSRATVEDFWKTATP